MKLNISAYNWTSCDKKEITSYRACIDEENKELIFVCERNIDELKNVLEKFVKQEIEKIEKDVFRLSKLKNSLEMINNDEIEWTYVSEHKKERYIYPSKNKIPLED